MCSVDDLWEVRAMICVYGRILKFRLVARVISMHGIAINRDCRPVRNSSLLSTAK